MRTVYLDSEFKCHVTNDGAVTPFETDFFDGRCGEFIEGHYAIPEGESLTLPDGRTFSGKMITPWKDSGELEAAQRRYEKERLADAENALAILYGGKTV